MIKKVVMFCGGSGSASIAKALVAYDVDLTLLVNCYDDGLSTGALRRAIPGMLGPSDIRKNINRFSSLPLDLDARIPVWNRAMHVDLLASEPICRLHRHIQIPDDCAIGNLLFAGYFLEEGDFNAAVDRMHKHFQPTCRVLNVTNGENLWLRSYLSDGTLLDEAGISEQGGDIINLALYSSESTIKIPAPNAEALKAIHEADLIIYAPGTQYSSLIPSYMTQGIGDALADAKVHKIWIANAGPDKCPHDISRLVGNMSHYAGHPASSLITWVLLPHDNQTRLKSLPTMQLPPDGTTANGRHDGYVVWESIQALK